MKTKVWFVLGHLKAGGAERVFWTLTQYFDKQKYSVNLILLDSSDIFFSTDLKHVNIFHLNSKRASRSFIKLIKLAWIERPDAVFTTGSHLNILMAFVKLFAPIPILIGREVNIPELMAQINGPKDRFWDRFVTTTYKKINIGICQSEEIKHSLSIRYKIPETKLKIIPNPVVETPVISSNITGNQKKLLVIARLAPEKGLLRLLDIFNSLPKEYTLNIAGDGPDKARIEIRIKELGLQGRVKFLGTVKNVQELIAEHGLLVLSSFTEGFPNVVLEALSVGIPVVSFKVSGIAALLKDDFNGFVVEQGDVEGFAKTIIKASSRQWNSVEIKLDVYKKFGVQKVVKMYEDLISLKREEFTKPLVAKVWQD